MNCDTSKADVPSQTQFARKFNKRSLWPLPPFDPPLAEFLAEFSETGLQDFTQSPLQVDKSLSQSTLVLEGGGNRSSVAPATGTIAAVNNCLARDAVFLLCYGYALVLLSLLALHLTWRLQRYAPSNTLSLRRSISQRLQGKLSHQWDSIISGTRRISGIY